MHHIGLSQVSFQITQKDQKDLTSDQTKFLNQHPGMTKFLLGHLELPIDKNIIKIIREHHSVSEGKITPLNKKEFPTSILCIISEIFTSNLKQDSQEDYIYQEFLKNYV